MQNTTLPMMFIIGGGLHLVTFFRYYRHARGKILIMSGGIIFLFGKMDSPAA